MTTVRTYEEEVKWRLDGLKEELESGCLDPELYNILIDLNSKGYFTFQSCAGHKRGDMASGHIDFCIGGKNTGPDRESVWSRRSSLRLVKEASDEISLTLYSLSTHHWISFSSVVVDAF